MADMVISLELLEQLERGNVLLFVGDRLARTADSGVYQDQLRAALIERCAALGAAAALRSEATFLEAAEAYADAAGGPQALVQWLRDQEAAQAEALPLAYRLIAGLTACNLLATTAVDQRLERAFEAAGRPLTVVVGVADLAFEDSRQATLYKLRGTLEQPESLVLTEDRLASFYEGERNLGAIVLQGYLARKTLLFVGYDLADRQFQWLYRKVTAPPLDAYGRPAYAFGELPSLPVARWCQKHRIQLIPADPTAFLAALTRQLQARQPARVPDTVAPLCAPDSATALPREPYKRLDFYQPEDQAFFFGRGREIYELVSRINGHRLEVLYGASGTGKTSLLRAGVTPRLEAADPPYTTVYVRALEDPAQAIRRAVERKIASQRVNESADEWSVVCGPSSSLVDFLAAATAVLGGPLVIILDQFEEFFIRLSPEFRAAFIADLGALYEAHDVPVKVVVSLREDWLAALSEVEARIQTVFVEKMRLLPLTRAQAREAITAPAQQLGVHYEPALLDRLLADLITGGEDAVQPPQLSLVCDALYRARPAGAAQITLDDYVRLGGVQGVLQAYLENELRRLPADERALAHALLEELVTSERTKSVQSVDDLARALGVTVAALAPTLEKLVQARLLRPVETPAGTAAYELAHEYLIAELKLSPEAVARKEAEELLRQGVANYGRFKTLLSAETFALVDAQRDRLHLDAAAEELLLRSALRHGQAVGYWVGRMEDETQALALTATELLASEKSPAGANLGATAGQMPAARLGALVERLFIAWRTGAPQTRAAAGEVLWDVRARLSRRWRARLALARAPRALRRVAPLLAVGLGVILIFSLALWGPRWWTPKPELAWVDVPAGEFQMGSAEVELEQLLAICSDCDEASLDEDERPAHPVALDAFRLGKYEVTNAQYAQCIRATVCKRTANPETLETPEQANLPVVSVSWEEAQTFCEWVGGRLPTEAEWEYAAAGPEERLFPWGQQWIGDAANYCDAQCPVTPREENYDDGYAMAAPVGSFAKGVSWCGAEDLAGNVWEWVADWYGAYSAAPQTNPTGPVTGEYKVVRGGAFDLNPSPLRAASRIYVDPGLRNFNLGFRCVAASPGP